MNKFLLLATFLAMAASVSYAMPAEMIEDEDEEINAALQELEGLQTDTIARAQWGRFRRIVRRVVDTVKKVCTVVPVVKKVCGNTEVQNDSEVADKQVCQYVSVADTVCKLVNIG